MWPVENSTDLERMPIIIINKIENEKKGYLYLTQKKTKKKGYL